MQVGRIPLNPLHLNLDNSENVNSAVKAIDIMDNHQKNWVKRPGLAPITVTGQVYGEGTNLTGDRIDELFWSREQTATYVFSGAKIYKLTRSSGDFTLTLLTTSNCSFSDILTAGTRPIIEEVGDKIFIANEKHIGYIEADVLYDIYDTDTDSPATCSYLTWMNQRLIAISNGSDKYVYWSEVNDYTNWEAAAYALKEKRPDNVRALGVSWGELLILGEYSLENWYDDGSGFIPKSGGATDIGIIAPSSLINIDQNWYFFDHTRTVVRLSPSSRQPVPISDHIAEELQNLSTVEDARGHFLNIKGFKFYILSFKTEDRTFVYNIKLGTWHEWGYWDNITARHEDFLGFSNCFSEAWNLNLWGDRRVGSGKIFIMSTDTYKDDSNAINSLLISGHVNRGSNNLKRCNLLRIKLKRGTGGLTEVQPYLSVKWRDDNGAWSNPIVVDLGQVGDQESVISLQRLGMYRTRQWEFSTMNNCDIIIMEAFEEFEVMSR